MFSVLLALFLATSIHAKALDPMGAPIAAARVTVSPEGGGAPLSAVTDERGIFAISLEPGRYTITVGFTGFADATRVVTVSDATAALPDFVLQVAGFRDDVTVSATAGYLATVIDSSTKTSTPLRDVPQSVSVITHELISDQLMSSVGDVVRYIPGITAHQG